MAQNNLGVLIGTILDAPVWVQEVIFLDLKRHLETIHPGSTAPGREDEIYPSLVPEISFKGKKELQNHDLNLDMNVYRYLDSALKGLRVIDITLNNFWTLEESSSYLAQCIKAELIKNPPNPVVSASIFYLGGEIRLGEYVKRLNMINIEQLDDILRNQKNYNEQNPDAKLRIGEIMVKMGLVANQDIDKIITIKNEAQKRFIMKNDFKQTPVQPVSAVQPVQNNAEIIELKQKLQKLTAENNLLKDKLRAIFNIQNKK